MSKTGHKDNLKNKKTQKKRQLFCIFKLKYIPLPMKWTKK